MSGGKKIVGYTKPGFSLLFDHISPDQHPIMHEVHSHYAALRAAGVIGEVDDAGLQMWLPPAAEKEAARLWAEHFTPTDKVIALKHRCELADEALGGCLFCRGRRRLPRTRLSSRCDGRSDGCGDGRSVPRTDAGEGQ